MVWMNANEMRRGLREEFMTLHGKPESGRDIASRHLFKEYLDADYDQLLEP